MFVEKSVLFDYDWNENPKPLEVLSKELSIMEHNSASNTTFAIEGGLLESLLRMYLRSKPFVGFLFSLDLVEKVIDCYEADGVFLIKKWINLEKTFMDLLNKGKFENTFSLQYSDKGAGEFEENDIIWVETKRSFCHADLEQYYKKVIEKIKRFFDFLSHPPQDMKHVKDYDKFKTIHILLIFNGDKNEFSKKFSSNELIYNEREIRVYWYCIHCVKEILFENMTGYRTWTSSEYITRLAEKQKMVKDMEEEAKKAKEEKQFAEEEAKKAKEEKQIAEEEAKAKLKIAEERAKAFEEKWKIAEKKIEESVKPYDFTERFYFFII